MADGELRIVVWNVEHGSAVFVNTPNGRGILLDAGASTTFSPAAHIAKSYSLAAAAFILSHADADHVRDIANVRAFLRPNVFYRNRTVPASLIYPTFPPISSPLKDYWEFEQAYNGPPATGSSCDLDVSALWGGLEIQRFCNNYPSATLSKLNDYSLVSVLRYGQLKFVFPGDLESPGWQSLLTQPPAVRALAPATDPRELRVLFASHHGHESGGYAPFLNFFRPHVTLISDKWGSPHTDYDTYEKVSSGHQVWNSETRSYEFRRILSTKVNDYVLLASGPLGVSIII